MREDINQKRNAVIVTYSRFSQIYAYALIEIKTKLKRASFNGEKSNRYFRKHLGFEFVCSYCGKVLRNNHSIIIIFDQNKFLMFRLKYGV